MRSNTMPTPDNISIPENFSTLASIHEISLYSGLEFCGSWRSLKKFLISFYMDIPVKSSEIEDAYHSNNISLFTIKVHSIKTCAAIIGLSELSEKAALLEKAGDRNDINFINNNIRSFVAFYQSYTNILSDFIEFNTHQTNLPTISENELNDARSALAEIASVQDYDGVEMILDTLQEYKLSTYQNEIINKIYYNLKKLAWDEVINLTTYL